MKILQDHLKCFISSNKYGAYWYFKPVTIYDIKSGDIFMLVKDTTNPKKIKDFKDRCEAEMKKSKRYIKDQREIKINKILK